MSSVRSVQSQKCLELLGAKSTDFRDGPVPVRVIFLGRVSSEARRSEIVGTRRSFVPE